MVTHLKFSIQLVSVRLHKKGQGRNLDMTDGIIKVSFLDKWPYTNNSFRAKLYLFSA